MTLGLTLAATALSIILLILIGVGDPKRRRASRLSGGHNQVRRYLYVVAAIIPGLLIAVAGDAAMWLVWFGACAVAGWGVTLSLAHERGEAGSKSVRR